MLVRDDVIRIALDDIKREPGHGEHRLSPQRAAARGAWCGPRGRPQVRGVAPSRTSGPRRRFSGAAISGFKLRGARSQPSSPGRGRQGPGRFPRGRLHDAARYDRKILYDGHRSTSPPRSTISPATVLERADVGISAAPPSPRAGDRWSGVPPDLACPHPPVGVV